MIFFWVQDAKRGRVEVSQEFMILYAGEIIIIMMRKEKSVSKPKLLLAGKIGAAAVFR